MKKILCTLLVIFLLIHCLSAQEKPIHEIHAAMVYNFTKYVQWPDENANGDFVVGVIGEDAVFNDLKMWYDKKQKGNKKYVIKTLTSTDEIAGCQVVYIGKSMNKEFDHIRNNVGGKSILTITDGKDLGQKGSCINFKVVDGKLRFELNQETISAANLKVSVQLSSMAIIL